MPPAHHTHARYGNEEGIPPPRVRGPHPHEEHAPLRIRNVLRQRSHTALSVSGVTERRCQVVARANVAYAHSAGTQEARNLTADATWDGPRKMSFADENRSRLDLYARSVTLSQLYHRIIAKCDEIKHLASHTDCSWPYGMEDIMY